MAKRKPATLQQISEFSYLAGYPDLVEAWRTLTTALETRFPEESERIKVRHHLRAAPAAKGAKKQPE